MCHYLSLNFIHVYAIQGVPRNIFICSFAISFDGTTAQHNSICRQFKGLMGRLKYLLLKKGLLFCFVNVGNMEHRTRWKLLLSAAMHASKQVAERLIIFIVYMFVDI